MMKVYPGTYEVGVNFPEGCYLLRYISGTGEVCMWENPPENKNAFGCDNVFSFLEEDEIPEAFMLGTVKNGNTFVIDGTLMFEAEDASLQ